MLKEVLIYPDPRLREVSSPIEDFDGSVAALARDLVDTCVQYSGAGLSAIQVGVPRRAFVVLDRGQYTFMANPEWRPAQLEEEDLREGCLSFPGQSEIVSRFPAVIVKYQDVTGAWNERLCEGIAAQAVQHEAEHLDGKLLPDKLDIYHRDLFLKRFRKRRDYQLV